MNELWQELQSSRLARVLVMQHDFYADILLFSYVLLINYTENFVFLLMIQVHRENLNSAIEIHQFLYDGWRSCCNSYMSSGTHKFQSFFRYSTNKIKTRSFRITQMFNWSIDKSSVWHPTRQHNMFPINWYWSARCELRSDLIRSLHTVNWFYYQASLFPSASVLYIALIW